MPGVKECGLRFGQRMPPPAAPEAKCAHCICRKYSSSNASANVIPWSLKVWIGPCSLSNSGRVSAISASASRISRPVLTAGITVSSGKSSAFLVEMDRREIEERMTVDGLVQPRFPLQLGPKDRNRLQVGSAVEPVLQIAQERPDILDEVLEAVRTVLGLHRVH